MLDCSISLTHKPHHQIPNPTIPAKSSRCRRSFGVGCCSVRRGQEAGAKDYYQLLGVSVDSTRKEIKEAYRSLQKKYHPDIAGEKSHEYTLMLNEAYRALMREDLRRRYDLSNGRKKEGFDSNFSGLGSSSWNGPVGPHALFVDENKCIGCRECVHYASKTFTMDDALGSARVSVQFGDDDKDIEVATESCPTDCIHWVESGELPLLEFLARPQPKEAHGIYGGGWERPRDVFAAVKLYQKQSKQRREQQSHRNRDGAVDEAEAETPAQAEARRDAGLKLRMGGLLLVWSRFREMFGFRE